MTPLHPSIVHFPIVLLIAAGGLYVVGGLLKKPSVERIGFVFHAAGLLGCILAIFTGDYQADHIASNATIDALVQRHESMVTMATYGFGMLGIWAFVRQQSTLKLEKIAFAVLFVGLNVFLGFGAHVGAEMVYDHGAGVAPMMPHMHSQPTMSAPASISLDSTIR